MRFNVTRLPDDTSVDELPISAQLLQRLKKAGLSTVEELLRAYADHTAVKVLGGADRAYDVAVAVCRSLLKKDSWEPQYRGMDEDDSAEAWLNAALLMTGEDAQKVLKRFSVRTGAQLGYILNETEYETVIKMAVKEDRSLPLELNGVLEDIQKMLPSAYELNIRGQFAAASKDVEIKDVFDETEFEEFRTFCACLGAVWIEDLDGFCPEILEEQLHADRSMVEKIKERCRMIECGEALRYIGVHKPPHRSDSACRAKRQAVNIRRQITREEIIHTGIYRDQELAAWKFREDSYPDYLIEGVPLAFSYCDTVYMCYGWNDLFLKVLRFLYEDSPKMMRKLIGQQMTESAGVVLYESEASSDVRRPGAVAADIVAETCYSAEDMIHILYAMLVQYRIEMSEFTVTSLCPSCAIAEYLAVQKEEHEDQDRTGDVDEELSEVNDDDDNDSEYTDAVGIDLARADDNHSLRRKNFGKWLRSTKKCGPTAVREFLAAINIASEWAMDLSITRQNFFDITDTYEMIKGCETLLANKKFAKYDTALNEAFTDAIDLLIDFCMETE